MTDIFSFFDKHLFQFFILSFAWVILFFGYRLIMRKRKGSIFPDISKQHIIYRENFASGKLLSAKLKGGASNCLKLIVTDKEIWTTSFFPFTAIIDMFGLENRIYKVNLVSCEENKTILGKSVILTFKDDKNKTNKLEIFSKNHQLFIDAIKSK